VESVIIELLPRGTPHTHYPLLFLIWGGFCGVPTQTIPKSITDVVYSIIIQNSSEDSSVAAELQTSVRRLFFFCMQILQSSRPEAAVI